MKVVYPKGIDQAKGTLSTRLETVQIPPPPLDPLEADPYSNYDRKDPTSPWNRYLAHKADEKLSYQKHLGFGQRDFPPGQVLAARRKENAIKKKEKLLKEQEDALLLIEEKKNKKKKHTLQKTSTEERKDIPLDHPIEISKQTSKVTFDLPKES